MQKTVLKETSDFSKNRKAILALLYLAGGKTKRYSRLQLGLYALKGYNLHHYKFKEMCSWGPSDCQFHEDLHRLCGDIIFRLYETRDKGGDFHGEYEIYDAIKSEARDFVEEIRKENPKGYRRLKNIATLVGSPPEKVSAMYLFKKFAPEYKKAKR